MTYLKEKPEVVCLECQWPVLHFGDMATVTTNVERLQCGAPANTTDAGWCPVRGKEKKTHALCLVANQDGKCEHYEPRNAEG